MNIKDFFKPSKLKVIIFIVISIITVISYFGSMSVRACIEGPCPQPTYVQVFGSMFFILGFFMLFGNISPVLGIVGLLLEIAMLYTISCVIASVKK